MRLILLHYTSKTFYYLLAYMASVNFLFVKCSYILLKCILSKQNKLSYNKRQQGVGVHNAI